MQGLFEKMKAVQSKQQKLKDVVDADLRKACQPCSLSLWSKHLWHRERPSRLQCVQPEGLYVNWPILPAPPLSVSGTLRACTCAIATITRWLPRACRKRRCARRRRSGAWRP